MHVKRYHLGNYKYLSYLMTRREVRLKSQLIYRNSRVDLLLLELVTSHQVLCITEFKDREVEMYLQANILPMKVLKFLSHLNKQITLSILIGNTKGIINKRKKLQLKSLLTTGCPIQFLSQMNELNKSICNEQFLILASRDLLIY